MFFTAVVVVAVPFTLIFKELSTFPSFVVFYFFTMLWKNVKVFPPLMLENSFQRIFFQMNFRFFLPQPGIFADENGNALAFYTDLYLIKSLFL